MQQKEQKKVITPEQVAETKGKLPTGYKDIISGMVAGQYRPATIRIMFQGGRTMKPVVLEAAKKLIETIDNLQTTKP